ncbi:MAG: hypothetical protein PF518_05015 [Spirochaetaceae bacterium]|nr:hypothetical protein [Spirochaetaceae bacterium]
MKKIILFFFIGLMLCSPLSAYKILYAEQFYELYHSHFYQNPDDSLENIHYLGMALRSDFANPLNALAKINNEKEWEKYRYLFYMHVNLRLIDSYIKLAVKFDRQQVYFYNAPWKDLNIDSLKKARECYVYAKNFWEDALDWSEKASDRKFSWMTIEDIQYWEDENYRIQEGELNYGSTLDKQLERVDRYIAEFEAMDENTY